MNNKTPTTAIEKAPPTLSDWERAARVCREVAELPDRTSPDENADFMLVTGDELQPMLAAEFADVRDAAASEARVAAIAECAQIVDHRHWPIEGGIQEAMIQAEKLIRALAQPAQSPGQKIIAGLKEALAHAKGETAVLYDCGHWHNSFKEARECRLVTSAQSDVTMAESKEATHRRFYEAFHAWFMQSHVDFWSEANAPEELATIAVEIYDRRETAQSEGK